MTDAAADANCASLHRHMMRHPSGGWGILPLQWVHEQRLASVRERHLWWTFRRCLSEPPGGRFTGRPPPPPPARQAGRTRCTGRPRDPDRTRTPGGECAGDERGAG